MSGPRGASNLMTLMGPSAKISFLLQGATARCAVRAFCEF